MHKIQLLSGKLITSNNSGTQFFVVITLINWVSAPRIVTAIGPRGILDSDTWARVKLCAIEPNLASEF